MIIAGGSIPNNSNWVFRFPKAWLLGLNMVHAAPPVFDGLCGIQEEKWWQTNGFLKPFKVFPVFFRQSHASCSHYPNLQTNLHIPISHISHISQFIIPHDGFYIPHSPIYLIRVCWSPSLPKPSYAASCPSSVGSNFQCGRENRGKKNG